MLILFVFSKVFILDLEICEHSNHKLTLCMNIYVHYRAVRRENEVGATVVNDVTRERLPVDDVTWSRRRKQENDLFVAVSTWTAAESTVTSQLDTLDWQEQRWLLTQLHMQIGQCHAYNKRGNTIDIELWEMSIEDGPPLSVNIY